MDNNNDIIKMTTTKGSATIEIEPDVGMWGCWHCLSTEESPELDAFEAKSEAVQYMLGMLVEY